MRSSARTRNTAEAFQTFLKVADRSEWVVDLRLKHNLARVVQDLDIQLSLKEDGSVEIDLFRYFLTLLSERQDELSRRHLQAFCEEPRLKAVRKHRYQDLTNPQESDYFLKSISIEAVEILMLNPRRLSHSLEKYLNRTELNYSLGDYIATDLLGEIGRIYSDWFGQGNKSVWYQLKRLSARKLQEKLRVLGVLDNELSGYCRAREWLYKVFTNPDSKKRWPDPTSEQYEMATQLYNSSEAVARLSVEEFIERVDLCVKAVVHQFSFEEVTEEIMGASTEVTLLDRLIEAEDATMQNRIYTLLDEAIEFLGCWLQELRPVDPLLYEIALKRYGSQMSQQTIATAVGLTRDRVRTRCSRICRQALVALQTSEPARSLVAEYGGSEYERAWEKMVEQLLPISARRQLSA